MSDLLLDNERRQEISEAVAGWLAERMDA